MASIHRTVTWNGEVHTNGIISKYKQQDGNENSFASSRVKSASTSRKGREVYGNSQTCFSGNPYPRKQNSWTISDRNQNIYYRPETPLQRRTTSPANFKSPVLKSGDSGDASRNKLGRHVQHVQHRRALLNPNIIRPLSAPSGQDKPRRWQSQSRSANHRERIRKPEDTDDDLEMHKLVKKAVETKVFQEETDTFRQLEKSIHEQEAVDSDATPVFNKRLFASQGTVIITREARRLMCLNARENRTGDCERMLSKSEALSLRCVTEGLKLIHKGQDFVKDVLARVVTFEMYKAYEYISSRDWEETLSCYFILNGAVEVTYDMQRRESRNVYQPNIIYSHGTGEYLGLVSPEGVTEDLTPPATIYTKELTQFIRVDRSRFHKLMQKASSLMDKRKRTYISNHSFLSNIADDVKEKILNKLAIQEYPANRVLLTQDEMSENIYIVMGGRCQCYREVYIPEAGKEVLFYLESREQDDFFGEECLLDRQPSYCTVVTVTATTCLKLHKSALQIVNRERLTRFIEHAQHEFPSDGELRDRGYKNSVWSRYKHGQIKDSLKEGGKLKYLCKSQHPTVQDRGPCEDEQYAENMYRFIMKGSGFEPLKVRAQSAVARKPDRKNDVTLRPQTATPALLHVPEAEEHDEPKTDNKENVERHPSQLMTTAKAKEIEKHLSMAMESKETMLKLLEENPDIGNHLKQTWGGQDPTERENFMKNGVLVTMRTEDIVRKAKALAETYADKWKQSTSDKTEEDWDTILHAENKQAKMMIAANRMRIKDLQRRMSQLQKHREKLGLVRPPEAKQDDLKVEDVSPRDRSPARDQDKGEGDSPVESQMSNGDVAMQNSVNDAEKTTDGVTQTLVDHQADAPVTANYGIGTLETWTHEEEKVAEDKG